MGSRSRAPAARPQTSTASSGSSCPPTASAATVAQERDPTAYGHLCDRRRFNDSTLAKVMLALSVFRIPRSVNSLCFI